MSFALVMLLLQFRIACVPLLRRATICHTMPRYSSSGIYRLEKLIHSGYAEREVRVLGSDYAEDVMADKVIVGCWVCGKHGGLPAYQRKLKALIRIQIPDFERPWIMKVGLES